MLQDDKWYRAIVDTCCLRDIKVDFGYETGRRFDNDKWPFVR